MVSTFKSWCKIGVLIVFFIPSFVYATDPSFTLGPGKIEVEVLPGASITRDIVITNNLGRTALFGISFEDIESSADGSDVVLLGDKTGSASLKRYLFVDDQTVSLVPGEKKIVPITIALPENAPVGSLHGVVIVRPQIQDIITGPYTVPRLGVLVFVRVAGERKEAGMLTTFFGKKIIWQNTGPDFSLTFKNTGNTYLNPYGLLTITSMLGVVTKTPIMPQFVLPEISRTRIITTKPLSGGIYRAKLELNRGYANIVDNSTVWFITLSWVFILFLCVLFICVVFGIWTGYVWYNTKR